MVDIVAPASPQRGWTELKSVAKTLQSVRRPTSSSPHSANHTPMRKTLLAAAALAPLWILASQTAAFGQTTISSNRSTPVDTATDGSITVNSGITINPATPNTAAVTINSNASVSNAGTITYNNVNNVVGIAVQGGFTGSVINSGTINITESYTASDTNKDGLAEAPFASGSSTGRYGIQLTGTSAFVGAITNTLAITVKGDNSYGISLEAPLQGALSDSGTITLTGDNGSAIREIAGVTGGNRHQWRHYRSWIQLSWRGPFGRCRRGASASIRPSPAPTTPPQPAQRRGQPCRPFRPSGQRPIRPEGRRS